MENDIEFDEEVDIEDNSEKLRNERDMYSAMAQNPNLAEQLLEYVD